MKRWHGFNLIEILITLTIIIILAAISVTSYSNHITRTNRLSAEASLSRLASLLEQYSIKNNTYKNATLDNLNMTSPPHYQLEIASTSDTAFLIAAHPLDTQEKNDTECATLILSSQNKKSITGTGTLEECW